MKQADSPAAPRRQRLPFPYRSEAEALASAVAQTETIDLDWAAVVATAHPWIRGARANSAPFWAMESLLKQYPMSSPEGLALMRLAESLLRVPDVETAVALTADQLGRAQFDAVDGSGGLLATVVNMSKKFIPSKDGESGLFRRLGASTVVSAAVRAIQLMSRQFVLGQTISEATSAANAVRKSQANLTFSYDMLGEGARTEQDAKRYLDSYLNAIAAIAGGRVASDPILADGISIKLSALYSRYEDAQRERVFNVLLPRVLSLIDEAAKANLNLTVDAEESDRLELSLDLFEAAAQHIASRWPQWTGFGLAIQAYQKRALNVVDEVARIAQTHGLRFMVRLVKGAYWDSEIKRAQEGGFPDYPVFTQKHHTDINYIACAARLLSHRSLIYPQFATHNAGTIAAIMQMANSLNAPVELQRLHGMGESVYQEVLKDASISCRVYAPVGEQRDLLAYLVRRLLENGANSSFVHLLADESQSADALLASPLKKSIVETLPRPGMLYGKTRTNSKGIDLSCLTMRQPLDVAVANTRLGIVAQSDALEVSTAMSRLSTGFNPWNARLVDERATILERTADLLEAKLHEFSGLLVKEAGKTLVDSISEVREAVDFCRYYAGQARERLGDLYLDGPTGESNLLRLRGRGIFVCISPWNFPLAIFAGQVVAALVAGNTVAAKPAEQTPVVAQRFVDLLHEAGVPTDAIACLQGPGETIGAALVADPRTAGVCFTGSTTVARLINQALAAKDGPIAPLIAETGGLNAMVVDSTALPEQVIDAVVQSAFRSAGQRCSALRLLCVHESIADSLSEMLRGAMAELVVGDPSELATDVGPLIDDLAIKEVRAYIESLHTRAKLIGETPVRSSYPRLVGPVVFEINRISDLKNEVFGPVLHFVRWNGDIGNVVAQINDLGYGLTMGVQTRIDSRAQRLADQAQVGNVYINRNMIGAVVGVQPFGGKGLSGTGPKAGGPHYLYRFCTEQTVTVNTAAAGGNAALLTTGH